MNEFRPRLRPNRKNKITRKDNLLIVTCDSPEEANLISGLVALALKNPPTPLVVETQEQLAE